MGMFAPLNSVVLNGSHIGLTARAVAVAVCVTEAQAFTIGDVQSHAHADAVCEAQACRYAVLDGAAVATADNHVHEFFVITPAPLDPKYPASAEASMDASATYDMFGDADGDSAAAVDGLVWRPFAADTLALGEAGAEGLALRPYDATVYSEATTEGYFYRWAQFARTLNAVSQAHINGNYVYVARARAMIMRGETVARANSWGIHTHKLIHFDVGHAPYGVAESIGGDFTRIRSFPGATFGEIEASLDSVWVAHGQDGEIHAEAHAVASVDYIRDGVRYADAATELEVEAEFIAPGLWRWVRGFDSADAEAELDSYEFIRHINFKGVGEAFITAEAALVIIPLGGVLVATAAAQAEAVRTARQGAEVVADASIPPPDLYRVVTPHIQAVAEAELGESFDRLADARAELESEAVVEQQFVRLAMIDADLEGMGVVESQLTRYAYLGAEVEAEAAQHADLIQTFVVTMECEAEAVIYRADFLRGLQPWLRQWTIARSYAEAELDVLPPLRDGLMQARAIAQGDLNVLAFVAGETQMGAAAEIPEVAMRKYTFFPLAFGEGSAETHLNTLLNNYFPASKHRKLFIEAETRSLPITHQDRTYRL